MGEPAMQRLEIRQEKLDFQAHFLRPVFDLFRDFPSLAHHLFSSLGPFYNLHLTDIKLEATERSLGEVHLRLTWPNLADVLIFLDRVELRSSYPQFLNFQGRDLVADAIGSVSTYIEDVSFRAYSVSQEVHGLLTGGSDRQVFLSQFTSSVLSNFGPPLGAGAVFYFGADDIRLTSSVTLDFSRLVEGGVFIKTVALYDSSKVAQTDLQALARSRFVELLSKVGLEEV